MAERQIDKPTAHTPQRFLTLCPKMIHPCMRSALARQLTRTHATLPELKNARTWCSLQSMV